MTSERPKITKLWALFFKLNTALTTTVRVNEGSCLTCTSHAFHWIFWCLGSLDKKTTIDFKSFMDDSDCKTNFELVVSCGDDYFCLDYECESLQYFTLKLNFTQRLRRVFDCCS